MTQFRVELVGGPKATRTVIDLPGDAPPAELAVNLEQGPPIQTEEAGSLPGVLTQAIYVHHETDADGVEVCAYSRERQVR
jgi:hypothetical protein